MRRVHTTLPQVDAYPATRPSQCPYWECGALPRHGEVSKSAKHIYAPEVMTHRYRIRKALTAVDATSG